MCLKICCGRWIIRWVFENDQRVPYKKKPEMLKQGVIDFNFEFFFLCFHEVHNFLVYGKFEVVVLFPKFVAVGNEVADGIIS